MDFRTFISGLGEYMEYGYVDVDEGRDPNFLEDQELNCYRDLSQREPVYPFHDCCFELLKQCLFWPSKYGSVDNDLLYSVMESFTSGGSRLTLDYGMTSLIDFQYWESHPGEEYLVVHPTEDRGLKEVVAATLARSEFIPLRSELNLGSRVANDPFFKLPYELLLRVLKLLSNQSILSLANASWTTHHTLRNNDSFWRQRIRDSMPWFFELHHVLDETNIMHLQDPKRLCLLAEKVSRPRRYVRDPFSKQYSSSVVATWSSNEYFTYVHPGCNP